MKSYIDCIPCFFKQAVQAARLLGLEQGKTRKILNRISQLVPEFSLTDTPPVMSRMIYRIIREETGMQDAYSEIKAASNKKALQAYPKLKNIVETARQPLLQAVELAIAGNIIDFGANTDLDIGTEIDNIIENEDSRIRNEDPAFFEFLKFRNSLAKASSVLYLLDNAGEIVFDKVLIEQIQKEFPYIRITAAVRGTPVINDCTTEDAKAVGLDPVIPVISNGTDAPGTILELCSDEFRKAWDKSDLVISKGQGNYETASEEKHNLFFLLIAKCPVIAENIGCSLGDILLFSG